MSNSSSNENIYAFATVVNHYGKIESLEKLLPLLEETRQDPSQIDNLIQQGLEFLRKNDTGSQERGIFYCAAAYSAALAFNKSEKFPQSIKTELNNAIKQLNERYGKENKNENIIHRLVEYDVTYVLDYLFTEMPQFKDTGYLNKDNELEWGTPLQSAVKHNCIKVFKFLLEHGVDITYQGSNGSILHALVETQNLTLLKLLVNKPEIKKIVNSRTRAKQTALDMAIANQYFDVAKQLVVMGADPLTLGYMEKTVLAQTITFPHSDPLVQDDICNFLLNHSQRMPENFAELFSYAVANALRKTVGSMLKISASKFYLTQKDFIEKLYRCVFERKGNDDSDTKKTIYTDILIDLVEAGLNYRESITLDNGLTLNSSLGYGAFNYSGSYTTPTRFSLFSGYTGNLLHIACWKDCYELVKYLINRDNAIINVPDSCGDLPLSIAVHYQNKSITMFLLTKLTDLSKEQFEQILDKAEEWGDRDVLRLLRIDELEFKKTDVPAAEL